MTSDLTKEIIVGSLSALFTALFAGIPGAALFWWTYMRDQERLMVEKAGPRELASAARDAPLKIGPSSVLEMIIRNRSLFSVHVMAVGFEIDGEVIKAEHPYIPNPFPDGFDPFEIPSQASLRVSLSNPVDRNKFAVALLDASHKKAASVESILNGSAVIAMVATETGKIFTSMSVRQRAYRWLLRVKREMDGQPVPEED